MSTSLTGGTRETEMAPALDDVVRVRQTEDAKDAYVQGEIDIQTLEDVLDVVLPSEGHQTLLVAIDEYGLPHIVSGENPEEADGEIIYEGGQVTLVEDEGTRYAYRTPREERELRTPDCPDCGIRTALNEMSGCLACANCGWARCS